MDGANLNYFIRSKVWTTIQLTVKKSEKKNWTGYLVQAKKEWLNPNELQLPHVVIEDRGPRVLIQLLPEVSGETLS